MATWYKLCKADYYKPKLLALFNKNEAVQALWLYMSDRTNCNGLFITFKREDYFKQFQESRAGKAYSLETIAEAMQLLEDATIIERENADVV